MKTSFYSEQEACVFEKKCKLSLALFFAFLSTFAIAFVLTIVLATYETKLAWMVAGSIACIIPFAFAFLFFMQWRRRKESLGLYRKILGEEPEAYRGTVIAIKDYPITLANSFEVFEVEVELGNDNKKIFYLSSDKKGAFEIKLNQTYLIWVTSLYIKEIDNA